MTPLSFELCARSEVTAGVFDSAPPDPSLPPCVFILFHVTTGLEHSCTTPVGALSPTHTQTHTDETDGPSYSIKQACVTAFHVDRRLL